MASMQGRFKAITQSQAPHASRAVVGHLSYFDMNTNFHDFRTDFTEIPRSNTTDWKI
jgi:hypothetical protein